jgi:biofilm protein TabA
MLFGNTKRLSQLAYCDQRIIAMVEEALPIAAAQPEGKYELAYTGAFVVVANAVTEPLSERKAEVHKHYIDVQIVLSGEERIGFSYHIDAKSEQLTTLDNDVMFFDAVEKEQFIELRSGDFAVFYPNQVHRPLCNLTTPSKVKKAIIKIPATLFE